MNHSIDSENLAELIETGRKAMSAGSNDAEHDALYEILIHLESLKPEAGEPSKPSYAKIP